jgi:hypothetical protein
VTTREQIVALHGEKLAEGAIAARLGITTAYVVRVLREAGCLKSTSARHASFSGANLADPNRADRALRRFSWEQA